MAIGTEANLVIYNEQLYGGIYEAVNENINIFNGASNNTIQLTDMDVLGDLGRKSFIQDIPTLISRRDNTLTTAATDLAVTMNEYISIKSNRAIGPVANTLDSWKKLGKDQQEMSYQIGKMIGGRKLKDMVNLAIAAVLGGVTSVGANVLFDYSGTGTISHTVLVNGLQTFGDAASQVTCWIMHSKVYFDLMKQAIADKVMEVAGVTIYAGTVATFGRPVIVVDAPALFVAGTPNKYNTLGLVEGAIQVTQSEPETVVLQMVTGLTNLVYRLQGEYALNFGLRGMKWVVGSGTNPTDAAVALSTNWTKVAYDNKLTAGLRIFTQ